MSSLSRFFAASAVVAVTLLLSACGGGDEEPLSKSEFVAQGNQICKSEWQTPRAELFKKLLAEYAGTKPTAKQKEIAMLDLIGSYEDAISGLDQLQPPDKDAATIESMIDEMEKAAAAAKADPRTVFTNTSVFEDANEQAGEYGLAECAV